MLAATPRGVGVTFDFGDACLGRLQPAPASTTSSTAKPIERNPAMLISPASEVTTEVKTWARAVSVTQRFRERELGWWREAALAAQPHGRARLLIKCLGVELDSDDARILQNIADLRPLRAIALHPWNIRPANAQNSMTRQRDKDQRIIRTNGIAPCTLK